MRKKFTKLALAVAGVAAFSGMTAMSAQASDGPTKPDETVKTAGEKQCIQWGQKLEKTDKYSGFACWQDGVNGPWYLDLWLER
ncbi:hypothetical protein [Streptomyces sp. 3N207]|uniref:hypothetical protein n=1 Tax=Streptomyces sp. 3N207 TaxID=3457417 RepID=UPI003FD3976F